MSLIEEALRKAQEAPRFPAPAFPAPQARPVPQAPSSPPAIPLATGAGLLLIGVLAWFWWGHRLSPLPAGPSARTPSVTPAPRPAAPAVAPRPAFRRPPLFQLTGVVAGPGEPLAIINGQIMKVGDTVSGATLLQVGSNSARLRWGDEELVLKTSP